MSASDLRSDGDATDESSDVDPGVVAGRLDVLREENDRLRREYARARRSQYRRSAAALTLVGVLAFAAGGIVANARTVLFALGGTGVFLGVLTYFLAPERFISASVGEAVYASLARNEDRLVDDLGLADERVYVPRARAGADGGARDVRLFVPQRAAYELPNDDELDDLFVVTDDGRRRGVSFRPTAADLYADFERAVSGGPSADPAALATELRDALVEQFELVRSGQVDADPDGGRVSVRVRDSTVGRVDRIDHPVASLFGVGLGRAVERPVTVAVTVPDDSEDGHVVTCSWGTEGVDDAPE